MHTCTKVKKRNFIASPPCGIVVDLFLKLRSNKESFKNIVHHMGPLTEFIVVLFLRNKEFNVNIFISDYIEVMQKLPIEERACSKTCLGGGDYFCTPPP